jgi:hypothetical protein
MADSFGTSIDCGRNHQYLIGAPGMDMTKGYAKFYEGPNLELKKVFEDPTATPNAPYDLFGEQVALGAGFAVMTNPSQYNSGGTTSGVNSFEKVTICETY